MAYDFEKKEVTVAESGTYSSSFTNEHWGMFYGAYFPAMDDGNIGLELSIDNGSTWVPVLDPADGADAVLCATGSDAGWVDFTDWVRFFPYNSEYLMRFTCASQTSGAVTITILIRG